MISGKLSKEHQDIRKRSCGRVHEKLSTSCPQEVIIVKKLSNWNYIVDIDGTSKVVNISKMKIYKGAHQPSGIASADTKGGQKTPENSQNSTDTSSDSDSDYPPFENFHLKEQSPNRPIADKRPIAEPVEQISETTQNNSTSTSSDRETVRRSSRQTKPVPRLQYDTLGGTNSRTVAQHGDIPDDNVEATQSTVQAGPSSISISKDGGTPATSSTQPDPGRRPTKARYSLKEARDYYRYKKVQSSLRKAAKRKDN